MAFLSAQQQQALAQLGGCVVVVLPNQLATGASPSLTDSALAPVAQQNHTLQILASRIQAQQRRSTTTAGPNQVGSKRSLDALAVALAAAPTASTSIASPNQVGRKRSVDALAVALASAPAASTSNESAMERKVAKWKTHQEFDLGQGQQPTAAAVKPGKATKWRTATTLERESYEAKLRPNNSILGPNAHGPKRWASTVVFNERQHAELMQMQMLNSSLVQARRQTQTQQMRFPPQQQQPRLQTLKSFAQPLNKPLVKQEPSPVITAQSAAAADGLLKLLSVCCGSSGGSDSDASSDTEATAEATMQPSDALTRLATFTSLVQ